MKLWVNPLSTKMTTGQLHTIPSNFIVEVDDLLRMALKEISAVTPSLASVSSVSGVIASSLSSAIPISERELAHRCPGRKVSPYLKHRPLSRQRWTSADGGSGHGLVPDGDTMVFQLAMGDGCVWFLESCARERGH